MTDQQRLAQVRARLELPMLRRAAGLLEGRHRSIFKGHGQDFDDLSLYNPGDDIGDIDWKSSARAGIPIIRRFVRQSNLTTVLAVDTGSEMGATAASGAETKGEVAVFLASIIAYVSRDRGDRVALVAGDSGRIQQRPPRASTQDLEILLEQVSRMFDVSARPRDLERVLRRVEDAFHRRALVVLVTDESQPHPDLLPVLRRLRMRHTILIIAVGDANPFSPEIATTDTPIQDVAGTLVLPPFLRGRTTLAQAAGQAAAQARHRAFETARAAKADMMITAGSDNALADLVTLLGRYRYVS
ncbi:DUF58 domain-containing protein [Rarobacter incanus]|uniref:Uncharacterized protein DUF58 n=1 Tax=Rarobacter incanus TaxID=153494 RepID=A0A542SQ92_9MICO|nr:DUF58 domain-containing protein [Rarobacter incanus]TQK76779.1 uncharacterized protein DUF58 [Rarobacter incanus]